MAEGDSAQESFVGNGNCRQNDETTVSEVVSRSTLLRHALEMGGKFSKTVGPVCNSSTKPEIVRDFAQPPSDHSYVYSAKSIDSGVHSSPMDDSMDDESMELENSPKTSENNPIFPKNFIEPHIQPDNTLQTVVSLTENATGGLFLNDNTIPEFTVGTSVNVASSLNPLSNSNFTLPKGWLSHNQNSSPVISPPPSSSVPAQQMLGTKSPKLVKLQPKSNSPLGSSDNPIQVIHQGNAFRSTQSLTKQQLQQITHVLQQQQLVKAIKNGGKSELYDQATNTRILYKVIYPSQVQTKGGTLLSSPEASDVSGEQKKIRPRKSWAKKSIGDDDRKKPLLSKAEREEKKKHRPRTRSGRISKPPSYMVKDYKRIHHLDFNEEPYDDSDGGYSDYQMSEEESEKRANKGASTGVSSTSKQRNYTCVTCSKAYIGKGGLSRHYKLNPNHGTLPDGEDVSTQDENSNSSFASSIFSVSGSATQGSVNVQSLGKPESETATQHTTIFPLYDVTTSKQKPNLKEILKNYSDSEVLEATLPKLLQAVSVWEFLLIRSKKGNSQHPDVPNMFKHFAALVAQMQKVARTLLTPTCFAQETTKAILNISSEAIAKALLIDTGTYFVKDLTTCPPDQQQLASMRNISLSADACGENTLALNANDLVLPPTKQRKLHPATAIPEVPLNSTLPDQILNDVTSEVENIEFQTLSPAIFERDSAALQQDSQIMSAISASMENHSEFISRSLFDSGLSTSSQRILQNVGNSTTVTPSSLSSGCLSAVDVSEALRTHNFVSTAAVQPLQNAQLQDVPLFGSPLPNFHSENTIAALQNYSESNVTQQHIVLSNQDGAEKSVSLLSNNVNNAYSQCPVSIALSNNDNNIVYNQDIHPVSSVGLTPTSAISLLHRGKNISNDSLIECQTLDAQNNFSSTQIMPDCLAPTNDMPGELQNDSVIHGTNVPVIMEPVSTSVEAERQCINSSVVTSDGQYGQTVDGAPIVRQLVLPDGQVIGVWPSTQNQSGKTYSEEFVQEYLPGNLIIVQNPDGTYQVPSDQTVPLEVLQAIISGNEAVETQPKKDDVQSQIL